jgi:hypothetical protein
MRLHGAEIGMNNTHGHPWVYMGDLILSLKRPEVNAGYGENRAEYCSSCGAVRVRLSSGRWSYLLSDNTRQFLKQFDRDNDRVIADPPDEFRFDKKPPKPTQQRLGRGLSELLQLARKSDSALPGLFLVKPEKKS